MAALPADARTREQLDWVAGMVVEASGTAGVWLSRPGSMSQERELATDMTAARAVEYRELIALTGGLAGEPEPARRRGLRRLRSQWRAIDRRDFFPPPEREQARRALNDLAASITDHEPSTAHQGQR